MGECQPLVAGSGQATSTDGTGTAAAFHCPYGIAIDPEGNLIVTDFGSHGRAVQVDPMKPVLNAPKTKRPKL